MAYSSREDKRRYARLHYDANKALYKRRAIRCSKATRENLRAELRRLKAVPCTDCKTTYPPYVMQFDHVRGRKLFDVSQGAARALKIERVIAEARKCEVVCANCHAERTWQRLQQKRAQEASAELIEELETGAQGALW